MNTVSNNIPEEELDNLPEEDVFSSSLAPVNRTEKLIFGLKDRLFCIGFLALFVAAMRFFLSK